MNPSSSPNSRPSQMEAYQAMHALATMLRILPGATQPVPIPNLPPPIEIEAMSSPAMQDEVNRVLQSLSKPLPHAEPLQPVAGPSNDSRPSATHYHPQPTRSGRTAAAPPAEELATWQALENFIQFPSDSESDDEDFKPNQKRKFNEEEEEEWSSNESKEYVTDSEETDDEVPVPTPKVPPIHSEVKIKPKEFRRQPKGDDAVILTIDDNDIEVVTGEEFKQKNGTRISARMAEKKAQPTVKEEVKEEVGPKNKVPVKRGLTADKTNIVDTKVDVKTKPSKRRKSNSKVDAEEKKRIKAERNKVFAEQSRVRAKAHLEDVEAKVATIPDLQKRIRELENEVKTLRNLNTQLSIQNISAELSSLSPPVPVALPTPRTYLSAQPTVLTPLPVVPIPPAVAQTVTVTNESQSHMDLAAFLNFLAMSTGQAARSS